MWPAAHSCRSATAVYHVHLQRVAQFFYSLSKTFVSVSKRPPFRHWSIFKNVPGTGEPRTKSHCRSTYYHFSQSIFKRFKALLSEQILILR